MTSSRINLVVPDKEGHWYHTDGTPCYEVPLKTDPSRTRPTNVRDAMELDLWPSVTTIMQMLHKPALAAWINTQYVLSALTLQQYPHESADEFAQRVVKDARVEAQTAADFGSRIHELVQQYLSNNLPDTLSSIERTFLEGFMMWSMNHKIEPMEMELSFCRPDLGFAGRLDFLGWIDGVYMVVDWKTQKTQPGKPVSFYPEWNTQLSPYAVGITPDNEDLPQKCSVVISSTEPGRVESFMWLHDPLPRFPWNESQDDWGWATFKALRAAYYSPLGQGWGLRKRY